ncbi:MAG: ABC transporter permease [Christensenellaceae bacterium]|nr:ABC transporter permease [Christensenellaceae bacterium]
MSISRGVSLLILLSLVVLISFSVLEPESHISYVFKAPKAGIEEHKSEEGEEGEKQNKKALQKSETQLLIEGLDKLLEDYSDVISAKSICSYKDGCSVTSDRESSENARLIGVWGDVYMLKAPVLTSGRLLYREEIDEGACVAVLDEKTAVKLFRTGEPIDRFITISDTKFRIVGIIKHSRQASDMEELRLTIPLAALDKAGIQSDVYSANFRTVPGKGAYSKLKNVLGTWREGGAIYNLTKEKQRSLLPVRWGLSAIGVLVLSLLLRLLRIFSKRLILHEKSKLEYSYFQRLLPIWIIKGIGVLILWAVWIALVYQLLNFTIYPVYIFPEWVPSVLVEWSDINTAFWNNRQDVSKLVEYRIPALIQLRFYHRALTLLCASIIALLLKPYHNLQTKIKEL